MQPDASLLHLASRRTFLNRATTGIASAVLANFLRPNLATAASSPAGLGEVDPLHFAPKAKRVIFLCMAGGPTHLETLDFKPKLAELHGQPMPESYTKGQPIAQL